MRVNPPRMGGANHAGALALPLARAILSGTALFAALLAAQLAPCSGRHFRLSG
jgi:hypothetical protein